MLVRSRLLVLFATAAPCAIAPGVLYAQHDHAAHAHVGAVAPPARLWVADPVLAANVSEIHAALLALRGFEQGTMSDQAAVRETGRIERATVDIFAKCKLEPERDAVLHRMLIPLLSAIARFKADPRVPGQVQAMRTSMAPYPRYFDRPQWRAEVAHGH